MSTHAQGSPHSHPSLGATADAILLITLVTAAAAAVAIGSYHGALALAAGGALLGIGAVTFLTMRGTTMSRLVLAVCVSARVALHIHLGRNQAARA